MGDKKVRRVFGFLLDFFGRLSPICRYQVEGESMAPTFRPGEGLLVNRLAYLVRPPRLGDIVVACDPAHPPRLLLKRVIEISGEKCALLGDNPEASRDSRHFGLVPTNAIIGKVIGRY